VENPSIVPLFLAPFPLLLLLQLLLLLLLQLLLLLSLGQKLLDIR